MASMSDLETPPATANNHTTALAHTDPPSPASQCERGATPLAPRTAAAPPALGPADPLCCRRPSPLRSIPGAAAVLDGAAAAADEDFR
jgi:hypothetical protein